MVVVGIIPARYGSTRFPGKPLARINGVSMIERVYKGALGAESLDDIRRWIEQLQRQLDKARQSGESSKSPAPATVPPRSSPRVGRQLVFQTLDSSLNVLISRPETVPGPY